MSSARPPYKDQLLALIEPAQILSLAVYHLIAVFASTLFKLDLGALGHPSKLRDDAFSNFWIDFTKPPPNPPTELTGSATLVPPLLATARGRVLEVGPGSGSQIQCFAPAASKISEIYAAEPATGLHATLRQKAGAAGLADKYKILTCSAETSSIVPALAKEGLLQEGLADEGVFDTVVCVRVLCSVPKQKETIENLYRLLRPGGQLIIVEHVVNPWSNPDGRILARLCQAFYMLIGWSFFVGDCHLDRDTGGLVRHVADEHGGWEKVDLSLSFGWSVLSYNSGRLHKRNKRR